MREGGREQGVRVKTDEREGGEGVRRQEER